MSITTGPGKKFLEEMFLGIHTLSEGSPSSDVIKVALYGPNAVLGPTIDTYTASNEVSGGGYTAGGDILTGLTVVGSSGSSRGDGAQFADPYVNPTDDMTILVSGVGVRGLMMYNSSQSDRNIFTLDFGTTLTPTTGILLTWGLTNVVELKDALIPLLGNTI